ncbi:DUF177 domain-containing protein [Gluconobacter albidus]|uniref:Phosphodiesterase n=1 Tax=Gluconobacter albidus TaxID=318683 RepID=A0AAW3R114_9PROT|nr:DUF177 domain-containing protein [Gluconobacter albidus]KXV44359.1 hypothetical protein AD941_00215 [Gluconobacter albidus]GBQ88498.1 hypothetical protein AA3250_1578 [Gluconobacter albidus NBRC 3250]GLQ69017.1 phosphodiesterase [Gluconobacter albidus]
MSHSPEFSRRIPFNRLGSGLGETIEASPAERAALAARLGLPEIEALTCRFRLTPADNRSVLAEGHLAAKVTQTCVITSEPFKDVLAETFFLRFIPLEDMPEDEFDIDSIDLDGPDDVPHDGKALDIGEATAEQLALMLDPYPRKPGVGLENAVDVAPAEGEEGAELSGEGPDGPRRPNPFSALSALKSGDRKE